MLITHLKNPEAACRWLSSWVTGTLRTDSRQVLRGDAFIAWPGQVTDGRQYVAAALAAGASTCLVEAEGVEAFDFHDSRVASLAGLKAATGQIADAFFKQPSQALRMVAITGTNGKTSSAWWVAQALGLLGQRCGVIGTLGVGQPPAPNLAAGSAGAADLASLQFTGLTTPDPVLLQASLRQMADQGYAACAVEASSIGVVEHRLAGMAAEVAVFTNFTRDHLDYHGDMAAYWAAKRELFNWPGLKAAVINVDDPQGALLVGELAGKGLDLWTISATSEARLRAEELGYAAQGLRFMVCEGAQRLPLQTSLIGDYNVSNLLGVIGALRALGQPLAQAVAAAAQVSPVPGRMQRVSLPGTANARTLPELLPEVVVDYAHTPDALEKALLALRRLAQARGGRLWAVFGCGGNRDATKRPLMGGIAARLADELVLTSDNPRHESPQAIINQIVAGVSESVATSALRIEPDRRAAIALAIAHAAPQDVILLAGKGHEDYQEIAGVKLPFADAPLAETALRQRLAPPLNLELAQALIPGSELVGAEFLPGSAAALALSRVYTDTRTLAPGDFFVALKGERFDAHSFLPQAKAAGAVAALATQGLLEAGLPGLIVPDTLLALQHLATGWRARHHLPLIGVTGSNGKTTVTQMIASILRAAAGEQALATAGNLNNHIGVPLTLLRLRAEHRLAVIELGMNHPGEIAELAAMAQPTVALVNNAQREHLEFMQSVEAVARENGSVISSLPADGVAVFPADDAYAPLWRELAGARRVLSFALGDVLMADIGAEAGAEVTGQAQWRQSHWALHLVTPAGVAEVALRVAGRHNVKNALAATACALAAGVPLAAVVQGLAAFEPVKGRSQVHALSAVQGAEPGTLIDDSYNANPDSVHAAIEVLAELPGPAWLILGDMGEVGDQGPAFHAEAGALAAQRGITHFWCVGELARHAAQAFGPAARHFGSVAELIAALQTPAERPAFASVLVKGSRFMKMEQVVAALLASAGPSAQLPRSSQSAQGSQGSQASQLSEGEPR